MDEKVSAIYGDIRSFWRHYIFKSTRATLKYVMKYMQTILTVSVGDISFKTERLETESKRVKGLSGKKCIPDDVAMLFVFDKPDTYGFWMKDMNFSIDMIWLDGDKKVVLYLEKRNARIVSADI